MALFKTYEERIPRCRAVRVDRDNIEDIARHYSNRGAWETVLTRGLGKTSLTISHTDWRDEHGDRGSLTIEAPSDREQVLIDRSGDNPPRLVDVADFHSSWREISDDA